MATAVVPHWLGKGWSQGSVRGLGDPRGEETKRGSKGERKRRIGGRGWKQWRHLSSVALARRNIRQDKLRDLPGSWTFLANCIRISTLHPTRSRPSRPSPPTALAAPMELELTRINHLGGSVRLRRELLPSLRSWRSSNFLLQRNVSVCLLSFISFCRLPNKYRNYVNEQYMQLSIMKCFVFANWNCLLCALLVVEYLYFSKYNNFYNDQYFYFICVNSGR